MSVKKKEIIIKTCDLCGKEVESFARADESNGIAIISIKREIWYGGGQQLDVCQNCSNKLLNFIDKLKDN